MAATTWFTETMSPQIVPVRIAIDMSKPQVGSLLSRERPEYLPLILWGVCFSVREVTLLGP
jgi:hypothetical protein